MINFSRIDPTRTVPFEPVSPEAQSPSATNTPFREHLRAEAPVAREPLRRSDRPAHAERKQHESQRASSSESATRSYDQRTNEHRESRRSSSSHDDRRSSEYRSERGESPSHSDKSTSDSKAEQSSTDPSDQVNISSEAQQRPDDEQPQHAPAAENTIKKAEPDDEQAEEATLLETELPTAPASEPEASAEADVEPEVALAEKQATAATEQPVKASKSGEQAPVDVKSKASAAKKQSASTPGGTSHSPEPTSKSPDAAATTLDEQSPPEETTRLEGGQQAEQTSTAQESAQAAAVLQAEGQPDKSRRSREPRTDPTSKAYKPAASQTSPLEQKSLEGAKELTPVQVEKADILEPPTPHADTKGAELSLGEASSEHASAPKGDSTQSQSSIDRVHSGRFAEKLLTQGAARREAAGEVKQVDPARFVQRVAGAFARAQQRDGEIRLRLSPAELGSLRLQIKLEDGAMTARLEAETSAARGLLLDNLPSLKERLAEQNIRIERFEVEVQQDTQAGTGQSHERQQQSAPRSSQGSQRTTTTTTENVTSSDQQASRATLVSDKNINVVV